MTIKAYKRKHKPAWIRPDASYRRFGTIIRITPCPLSISISCQRENARADSLLCALPAGPTALNRARCWELEFSPENSL